MRISEKLTQWMSKERPFTEVPLCDFERLRYEIRPCDVLLVEGTSRVSELIKSVTQSSWSHSALYIGRLHDIENPILRDRIKEHYDGDPGEQLLIEGMLGQGIIVTPLSFYERMHLRICRPHGISRRDAQQVIGFTIGRLGGEYHVRQTFDLFRLMLPWGIIPRRWRSTLFEKRAGEPTQQICSSLIAHAFASVRFPVLPFVKKYKGKSFQLMPRNPMLFVPRDFDYSPYFEIIKYPVFGLPEIGLYRDLPWNEEGVYSNEIKQAQFEMALGLNKNSEIKENSNAAEVMSEMIDKTTEKE